MDFIQKELAGFLREKREKACKSCRSSWKMAEKSALQKKEPLQSYFSENTLIVYTSENI